MALIVEDGTVVANADSFISLADARTESAKYGLSINADDTLAEVELRQAYLALVTYEQELQGRRVSATQTGIYPRSNVEVNCFPIASNVIPNQVIMAQLYQTDAINTGSYSNNATLSGEVLSSFEVVGAYKESYQDGSEVDLNATVQGVYNSLYPLTKAGECGSGYGNGVGKEEFGFVGR